MRALLLALALLIGGSTNVLAQAANGTSLAWTVTGQIKDLPGVPPVQPFSCAVTFASPSCKLPTGTIAIDFVGVDADSFKLQFQPIRPCGGESACSAQLVAGGTADQVDAVTCNGSTITAAASTTAFMPCPKCFGGVKPLFVVDWQAQATCVTTTSTTTSSSTSTSSTTTSTSSTTSTT